MPDANEENPQEGEDFMARNKPIEPTPGHYTEWYEHHNTPEKIEQREFERRQEAHKRQNTIAGLILVLAIFAIFGFVLYLSLVDGGEWY